MERGIPGLPQSPPLPIVHQPQVWGSWSSLTSVGHCPPVAPGAHLASLVAPSDPQPHYVNLLAGGIFGIITLDLGWPVMDLKLLSHMVEKSLRF